MLCYIISLRFVHRGNFFLKILIKTPPLLSDVLASIVVTFVIAILVFFAYINHLLNRLQNRSHRLPPKLTLIFPPGTNRIVNYLAHLASITYFITSTSIVFAKVCGGEMGGGSNDTFWTERGNNELCTWSNYLGASSLRAKCEILLGLLLPWLTLPPPPPASSPRGVRGSAVLQLCYTKS